ncbi:MAG TPA: ATP-dependent RecD-like DNA helicase, partial [Candidatus Nitrosocosmicus sp.]|nr:ATP-dependent RecD-like DNA helicase [Candidatus Nitrosocosmicus sp.]
KLLEYEPIRDYVEDPITGKEIMKFSFAPTRHENRPLPATLKTIVFEESSQVALSLFKEVLSALDHHIQMIFLGDIQQLAPVFGPAILGFKMLELPCVELTEVYRQALDSPIIKLAHRIISGVPITASEYPEWKVPGKLTMHPWKKKIDSDVALQQTALFLKQSYLANVYNPEADIILSPYGKAFGADEINKHVANMIAKRWNKEVFEILAGFEKLYLSVDDRVLVDREQGIIKEIKPNPTYLGKTPKRSSTTLDYWGFDPAGNAINKALYNEDECDVDKIFAAMEDKSERVNQASHIISIYLPDTERTVHLKTSAELNGLLLAYALTVFKSQGSEWRKVFFILHQSQATMIQRELLYTGVTRAREELYVICEPETFTNGIRSQRIKGNTLAEKAEFFKGKFKSGEY